jgi:hypothetical protein
LKLFGKSQKIVLCAKQEGRTVFSEKNLFRLTGGYPAANRLELVAGLEPAAV